MKLSKSEAGRLGAIQKSKNIRINYLKNMNKCKKCNNELDWEKRRNSFCGKSCAAIYNNEIKSRNLYKGSCLNCKKEVNKSGNKYCSNKCQGGYRRKKQIADFHSNKNLNYTSSVIRTILIEVFKNTCQKCLLKEWMGRIMPLEVHHIDRNHENNKKENLELLCLNCHALTENYKNKGGISSTRFYRNTK
jgi:hypothetical protein